jgi:phosphodiesterase/alkaline phosphatase D-like protein
VNGAILTFKTGGKVTQILPAVPVVTTQLASAITSSGAVVAGTVNPYGSETSYWFEYSTNADYSQSKTTPRKSAGAVSATVSVQASLTGLKTNTTYYVRVIAENPGGTVKGSTQSFQTK